MLHILSIGGSLIVPNDRPDKDFLQNLRSTLLPFIQKGEKFVLVSGGGKTARHYIDAARAVTELVADDLDWLGIHATRLNGHLLRTIFRDVAHPNVIKNPLVTPKLDAWKGSVLVVAGWKPGWSTDYVACRIAKRLGVDTVVNLSNIDKVFTADPRIDSNAQPVDEMSWKQYRAMIGDVWSPGMSAPFDPIASRFCQKNKLRVPIINGTHIHRLQKFLQTCEIEGTLLQ